MAAAHALLPGTFDPFTLGHLDLARRAAALFGRVTLGVATHPEKRHLFPTEERVALARASLADVAGAEVLAIEGLVVDAARRLGATVIVRGVRGGTDLDYETPMARTNRVLAPEVDTVLLLPSPEVAHVSSTLVRQIASMGGDVAALVPEPVRAALAERFPTP